MQPITPIPLDLPVSPFAPPIKRRRTREVAKPLVSVVIVNYCDWEGTAALVRQLLRTSGDQPGQVEVIVVDNHSPPHPLMRKLRRWPRVSLRRWGRNRGFAKAVNEGCRLSRGDWVLLLNPDVSIPPGFVEGVLNLADQLREMPRAGVVGFRLHNSDGSLQLSAGPFPSLASTLAGLTVPRARRKYRPVHATSLCRVPWVTGCCLLLRRECVQQLSGFDPSFFLYYEDVDFCRRARAHGWSVWHEPRLFAIHHAPLHTRPVSPALRAVTRHALLTYSARHWPVWQHRAAAALVRVEATMRRWWARWRGDPAGAADFAVLGQMARELGRDNPGAARRHLQSVVRRLGGRA